MAESLEALRLASVTAEEPVDRGCKRGECQGSPVGQAGGQPGCVVSHRRSVSASVAGTADADKKRDDRPADQARDQTLAALHARDYRPARKMNCSISSHTRER